MWARPKRFHRSSNLIVSLDLARIIGLQCGKIMDAALNFLGFHGRLRLGVEQKRTLPSLLVSSASFRPPSWFRPRCNRQQRGTVKKKRKYCEKYKSKQMHQGTVEPCRSRRSKYCVENPSSSPVPIIAFSVAERALSLSLSLSLSLCLSLATWPKH